jgi:hypothetical protein
MEQNAKNAAKKPGKLLYLAPVILSIIYILWLMVFSLDVFGEKLPFWATAWHLFLHNIPALALLAGLIISLKYELAGAAIFFIAGACLIYLLNINRHLNLQGFLAIAAPAFLIGALFMTNWMIKKHKTG